MKKTVVVPTFAAVCLVAIACGKASAQVRAAEAGSAAAQRTLAENEARLGIGRPVQKIPKIVWTPEKLKALRVSHGQSQKQFAQRLMIPVERLRKWEAGLGAPSGLTGARKPNGSFWPAEDLLDQFQENVRKQQQQRQQQQQQRLSPYDRGR